MRVELVKSHDPVKLTPAGWACAIATCVLSVVIAYQYAVWDLKHGDDRNELEEKIDLLAQYPIVGVPVAIIWIGIGIRHFAIDYRWVSAKEGRYFGVRSKKALYYWGSGLLLFVASIWGL